MKTEVLLKEYETFKGLTQEMLKAVESDDWDRIVSMSERREKRLEGLIALGDALFGDSSERIHGSDLIRQCLEMNGKMQSLIEAKREELRKSFIQEKKMLQAYPLY
ncbi:MAG: flagellar protein FliT [Candidatus Manganitrophaceae bacterium]